MANLEAKLGKMQLPQDEDRLLAGDGIIADAKHQLTFHRDVEAPVSLVWRYVMQLGCDRTGWYSIDSLDRGGVPSIDHLVQDGRAGRLETNYPQRRKVTSFSMSRC